MSTAMFTGLRTGMRRDSAPDLHADPHSLARLVVGSQASCPYVSASFPTSPPFRQLLTTSVRSLSTSAVARGEEVGQWKGPVLTEVANRESNQTSLETPRNGAGACYLSATDR